MAENSKEQLIIKATKVRADRANENKELIWAKMVEAAEEGKFEVWISEEIVVEDETIAQLKREGYHIKKYYGDIDPGGKYWMGGIEISWKITLLDRIKERMRVSVQSSKKRE